MRTTKVELIGVFNDGVNNVWCVVKIGKRYFIDAVNVYKEYADMQVYVKIGNRPGRQCAGIPTTHTIYYKRGKGRINRDSVVTCITKETAFNLLVIGG